MRSSSSVRERRTRERHPRARHSDALPHSTMSHALAVNCGSSSIKFQLYDPSLVVVVAGSATNVQGSAPAQFSLKHGARLAQRTDRTLERDTPYAAVFDEILKEVRAMLNGQGEIGIVAHRIVHGGTATDPIVIRHGDVDEQKVGSFLRGFGVS